MPYELICSSVRGASHIKADTPCEDYGLCESQDGMYAFVTADGHGDSNCPRSGYGSETVCKIAVKNLLKFGFSIKSADWERKMFPQNNYENSERNKLIHQLVISIVAEWSEIVNDDLKQNPLTEAERAGCSKYIDKYDRGEHLEHIYGTTMIAGLCTENYILLLQQGDGRCVVFDQNGKDSQPVPWDDRCFLNSTTSMCDMDVIDSVRYHVIDQREEPVSAVLACSDGIEDTFFSMDNMNVYLRSLLSYAGENGVWELEKHLYETLPEFTAKGSQDDCTITGIIDGSKVKSLADAFEKENNATVVRSKLKKLHEQVDVEMPPKLQFLQEKAATAKKRYDSLLARETELEELLKQCETEIRDAESAIQDPLETSNQVENGQHDNKTAADDEDEASMSDSSFSKSESVGDGTTPLDNNLGKSWLFSQLGKSAAPIWLHNVISMVKDENIWNAIIKLKGLLADKEKLQKEYEDPSRRAEMEKCQKMIHEYEEYKAKYDNLVGQLAELEET